MPVGGEERGEGRGGAGFFLLSHLTLLSGAPFFSRIENRQFSLPGWVVSAGWWWCCPIKGKRGAAAGENAHRPPANHPRQPDGFSITPPPVSSSAAGVQGTQPIGTACGLWLALVPGRHASSRNLPVFPEVMPEGGKGGKTPTMESKEGSSCDTQPTTRWWSDARAVKGTSDSFVHVRLASPLRPTSPERNHRDIIDLVTLKRTPLARCQGGGFLNQLSPFFPRRLLDRLQRSGDRSTLGLTSRIAQGSKNLPRQSHTLVTPPLPAAASQIAS